MGGSSSTPRKDEESKENEGDEEKTKKILEDWDYPQTEVDEEIKKTDEHKIDIQKEIVENLEEQEELTRKLRTEESQEVREALKRKENKLNELYRQLADLKMEEAVKWALQELIRTSDELENRENRAESLKPYKEACRSLYDLDSTFEIHIRSIESQLEGTIQDIDNGRQLENVPDLTSLVDDDLQELGAQLQQFVPDESEPTHANLRYIGLKLVGELNRLLNEIISRIELYQAEYDPDFNGNAACLQRYSIREHVDKVHKLLDKLNSALRELWRDIRKTTAGTS